MGKERYLVLEDGSIYEGKAFGSDNFHVGEIISNTSMMGYQEILSDNNYVNQIIVMTYPMIGSYGITREGFENTNPYIFGLVVGEKTDYPSNWMSEINIDEFLKFKGIPGIEGIDTRALTKKIRKNTPVKAVLTDNIDDMEKILEKIKNTSIDVNLAETVSTQKSFRIPNQLEKIVVIDMGSIDEIIKELNYRKKDITVVPYDSTSEEILSLRPDGVIISSGPGNPNILKDSIKTIKELIGQVPILGIGLGLQLIALAYDAKVERLNTYRQGVNYPVKNIETGKVENLMKNNSFGIVKESLENKSLEITHFDVNTNDIDGIADLENKVLGIQYIPKTYKDSIDEVILNFYKFVESETRGEING